MNKEQADTFGRIVAEQMRELFGTQLEEYRLSLQALHTIATRQEVLLDGVRQDVIFIRDRQIGFEEEVRVKLGEHDQKLASLNAMRRWVELPVTAGVSALIGAVCAKLLS
jgi:hypothetical protein